jgi:hypothetical protein
VAVIAFPAASAGQPADNSGGPVLVAAAGTFLSGLHTATTRAAYTETLGRLVDVAGEDFPVAALTPEVYGQAMSRWDGAAAGTWKGSG